MNATDEQQIIAEDATRDPRPKQQGMPVCPHCLVDPCTLISVPCGMGEMLACVFACGACRKIISVAPVAISGNPVVPTRQSEPSMIVRPH